MGATARHLEVGDGQATRVRRDSRSTREAAGYTRGRRETLSGVPGQDGVPLGTRADSRHQSERIDHGR